MTNDPIDQLLDEIAVEFSVGRPQRVEFTPGGIDSGKPKRFATPLESTSSGADFYEVAVWQVKRALLEAVRRGYQLAVDDSKKSVEKISPTVMGASISMTQTYEQELARHTVAFDKVKPTPNWKMPISQIIPTPSPDELRAISDAVFWFCGCPTNFATLPNGKTRVTAIGYYNAVGA
jgi:hypothetical protein